MVSGVIQVNLTYCDIYFYRCNSAHKVNREHSTQFVCVIVSWKYCIAVGNTCTNTYPFSVCYSGMRPLSLCLAARNTKPLNDLSSNIVSMYYYYLERSVTTLEGQVVRALRYSAKSITNLSAKLSRKTG